ncbi:MAG: thioredoxin [Chloroflexi bacterium]|nr:thioredoxin [Chloroflexota bacterium]
MFDTPIHTNEQSIDRVLKTGLPVLLVFWRDGCAPCQQLDPILDRLARSYAGRALIAKVNVSDNPGLVQRYRITRLPGLVFVKDGHVEAEAAGAAPESSLRAWLDYLTRGGTRPTLPSGPAVPLDGAAGQASTHGRNGHRPSRPEPRSGAEPWRSRGASAGGRPITLTDANFDQIVMGSDVPVLVDFWAAWCGPCRMIAPVVEQLAQEFDGRLIVGKLNVDENPAVAQRFGIMSIPTLLIFKNGRVVDQIVGAQPAHILRQRVMRHL